jgi:aldehyde:ferredoxin oxidoreductase
MLGMTQAPDIFVLIEDIERMGLDVISTGVALAWATEALEKGIISLAETGVSLEFGQLDGYRQAILSLAHSKNRFYTLLGQGLPVVCQRYGGFDFACVLGQEMAGYATGETYFVSQALGFRHSHLDTGAYAFDQESKEQDIDQALKFLIEEEQDRILLCSLVGCLFGRKAYPPQTCVKALNAIGYSFELKDLWQIVQHVQKSRWRLKLQTGYDPRKVSIPRRFLEVVNWKGPINADYLNELKERYSQAILSLASSEERDV